MYVSSSSIVEDIDIMYCCLFFFLLPLSQISNESIHIIARILHNRFNYSRLGNNSMLNLSFGFGTLERRGEFLINFPDFLSVPCAVIYTYRCQISRHRTEIWNARDCHLRIRHCSDMNDGEAVRDEFVSTSLADKKSTVQPREYCSVEVCRALMSHRGNPSSSIQNCGANPFLAHKSSNHGHQRSKWMVCRIQVIDQCSWLL